MHGVKQFVRAGWYALDSKHCESALSTARRGDAQSGLRVVVGSPTVVSSTPKQLLEQLRLFDLYFVHVAARGNKTASFPEHLIVPLRLGALRVHLKFSSS